MNDDDGDLHQIKSETNLFDIVCWRRCELSSDERTNGMDGYWDNNEKKRDERSVS